MTGKIMKGIGGFYYVYVEGSGLYECRARGIFRNKKMKPNVGDVVDIDILSEEEKTGNLVKIHKRKNQLIRPMAANVDQALVIFAVHEPEPNFHLLNRFLITMEQQEIPVIICFNKTGAGKILQKQLKQWMSGDFPGSSNRRRDYTDRRTPSWQDNNYGRSVWCREIFYFKLY